MAVKAVKKSAKKQSYEAWAPCPKCGKGRLSPLKSMPPKVKCERKKCGFTALQKSSNNFKKEKVLKARPVEDALQEFRTITEARYRIAKSTYEKQDRLTKEVIDRIRDRLRIAATGVVNINGRPYKLEQQYVDFNIWFIATEIVADLALNGIRVASFVFDDVFCAVCKKQLVGVKEPKKKRNRR